MSDFIELCAIMTRESDAIGAAPPTVLAQLGRQEQCVKWVAGAWEDLQKMADWSFREAYFEDAPLVVDSMAYNDASWSLERFGRWLGDTPSMRAMTIYDPAIGKADERDLQEVPYTYWVKSFRRGVHDASRPRYWAIAPDGSLVMGPKPDDEYLVSGRYQTTPQILAENTDVPEMPERFHRAIVWKAIMLSAGTDESSDTLIFAKRNLDEELWAMRNELLPKITRGGGRLA